jgi:hypothetical protein
MASRLKDLKGHFPEAGSQKPEDNTNIKDPRCPEDSQIRANKSPTASKLKK